MKKRIIILSLLISLLISACAPVPAPSPSAALSAAEVHFIDVGQADSTLIISNGQTMLIDAGTNDMGDTVVSYLKSLGIKKLDYLIGTHPHEDHIGGLDDVISSFETDVVIMPEKQSNTATFEDVLDALIEKQQGLTAPVPGTKYALGDCSFTILAPLEDYGDNMNDWSVGLKLTCGDVSFAFFGDAEKSAETDILASGADISADVLKVSHHGSDTSTDESFLDAISPTWGVISCGEGNSYGHPCQETLDKLTAAGVELRRTDLHGTIIAATDGKTVSWTTSNNVPVEDAAVNAVETQKMTYVLNTSSKKFHLPDCSSVSNIKKSNLEKFTGTRDELIKQGYDPCGSCEP
ncbi:MAG: MBL fold metallo-hydrolase [Ruminococcaceae bacterium]|nr:MBL fold metallo-hydrolase [Oscillospiraceae bacterium]